MFDEMRRKIMKLKIITLSFIIGIWSFISIYVYARDAARDLSKLVGYTIVMADTIDKVFNDNYSGKYVKLSNGSVFKVEFLLLDPLSLTEVVIFAKPLQKEIVDKFNGKLPDHLLYSYKILIDNEIHDATPQ
jgi:hypothetical protein